MPTANTCSNCGADAVHYDGRPGANPVYYCRTCLPSHLQADANQGKYNLPSATPKK